MAITLESFAARCHDILKADPGPAGREKVCDVVREALQDADFIARYLTDDAPERKILYQDPELGFCILGHVYQDAKGSAPHDHGPTWAIYGQATGTTLMTDWELVEPATDSKPGTVRHVRDYVLTPGMAYAYDPGALHSPRREGPTKLIRMEGVDVSKVGRRAYRAAA
jgi:hypothetical protein